MTDRKSNEERPTEHSLKVTVNGNSIRTVLIGRHYLKKHSADLNDELILELVLALNGHTFAVDSSTEGVDYYVADVELESKRKIYRIIWLFEGNQLEVIGVINAYRRSKKKR